VENREKRLKYISWLQEEKEGSRKEREPTPEEKEKLVFGGGGRGERGGAGPVRVSLGVWGVGCLSLRRIASF